MRATVFLLTLLYSTITPAAGDCGREGHFDRLDADNDGFITRSEAEAAMPSLAKHFDRIDVDDSGQLSKDEVRQARSDHRRRASERFAKRWRTADVDGDGSLDLAEAQTGMPRLAERFSAVDADNDGRITTAEMKARRRH